MRKVFYLAVFGIALITLTAQARAQQAIFLVRHAEKLDESKDPPLSMPGQARARLLARMLKDTSIRAIYSSPYQRNIKTAEPLARLLKLEPIIIPPGDRNQLINRIRTQNSKDVVLIVGHSDTVPLLLKDLGYSGEISIASNEYDNLFILIPHAKDSPTLLRLRY